MKTDLITSIGLAIFGIIVSFLVCNLFFGQIEAVEFKTIDSNISMELGDPDPEIFNYKAINPTVEVYVGNCKEVDSNGECVSDTSGNNEQNTNGN